MLHSFLPIPFGNKGLTLQRATYLKYTMVPRPFSNDETEVL